MHTKPESRSAGVTSKRKRERERERRRENERVRERERGERGSIVEEEAARDIFRYVNKYKVNRQTFLGYKGLGNCCA